MSFVRGDAPLRFPALEGARGIAALCVVAFHVGYATILPGGDGALAAVVAELGRFGVAIFFVLSGFLLYRPFLVADLAGGPHPRWGPYYARRLLRIIPAYWVVLLFAWLVFATTVPMGRVSTIATYFGLVEIYRPSYVFGGLGVAWTLCIELAFYVVLPPLAWAIRRITGPGGSRSPRGHLACLGWLYLVAVAYRSVVVDLVHGPRDPKFELWLPNHLDWFALGMSLAVLQVWRENGLAIPSFLERLVGSIGAAWLLAGALFVLTLQLHLPRGFANPSRLDYLAEYAFIGLSATCFLVPGVFDRTSTTVGRIMTASPVMFTGAVSYGVYLWHRLWLQSVRDLDLGLGFWALLGVVLVPTLVSATLSLLLVENPARRLGQNLSRR